MNGWNDGVYFWAMAACGGLSAFPFRLAPGWRIWPVFIMGAGLGVYLQGGGGEPTGAAAATALMMFVWLNGMAKLGLLQLATAWSGGSRRRMRVVPQRRIQLAMAATILLGCAQWFSSMGGDWSKLRDTYGLARIHSVQAAQLSDAEDGSIPTPKSVESRRGG